MLLRWLFRLRTLRRVCVKALLTLRWACEGTVVNRVKRRVVNRSVRLLFPLLFTLL